MDQAMGKTWYNKVDRSVGIFIVIISLSNFDKSSPLDKRSALLSAEITLTKFMLQLCLIRKVCTFFHSLFTQKSQDFLLRAAPSVVVLSVRQEKLSPATWRFSNNIRRPRRPATVSAQAIVCLGWFIGLAQSGSQLNWAQDFPMMIPIPNEEEASPTQPTFLTL